MSEKEISNQFIRECLNPNAETVNISHVNFGCTFNNSETQSIPSIDHDHTEVAQSTTSAFHNDDELKNKIESVLKDLYEELTLPSLPWLDKADIDISNYVTLQLESQIIKNRTKIIQLKTLFNNVADQKRKRILIEAQPGFGKTTLAHKIVSDWYNGEDYVKHFKFAILIILRDYNSNTLKDTLTTLIKVKNCDSDIVWRIINSEETLLIFDGFDEVDSKSRKDIVEVLYDIENEYRMTIITTCRIGLSHVGWETIASKFGGASYKKDIWCKKIQILGITSENRREFLEKFVEPDDKEKLMPRLREIIRTRENMFKSPLLLLLLVYVTSENHDVEINTDTDLYKNLVDCIIRRSVNKTNPETLSCNFTLFASCSIEPTFDDCKRKFLRFGVTCFDRILNNNLQFNASADNEAIHQVGFLLKHVRKSNFGPIVRYEGFHMSILEFAAAVYMSESSKHNENRFQPEDIAKFCKLLALKRMASPILLFLCDLVGNGFEHLLAQLSHHFVMFWANEDIVKFLFQKRTSKCLFQKYLAKFVPPYINLKKLYRIFPSEYYYLENYHVVELNYASDLHCITHPVHLRCLLCNICDRDIEDLKDILHYATKITCDSLIFAINNRWSLDTMVKCLKIFGIIESKCKNLYIYNVHPDHDIRLEQCVTSGVLVGEKINNAVVVLGNFGQKGITKLIECNNVTNLILVDGGPAGIDNYDIENICYQVAPSSKTTSLQVLTPSLCLDLDKVINYGGKKWQYLHFDCVDLKSKESSRNNIQCVKSLALNPRKHQMKPDQILCTLLSTTPSRLHCSFNALNSSSWDGWKTIEELTLTVLKEDVLRLIHLDFPDFSKLENLKTLILLIDESAKLQSTDEENIVKSIKFLNIQRLEIKWINSYGYFYKNLIDGVRELIQDKAISCTDKIRFEVIVDELRPAQFDFETIMSILQCDSRVIFCVKSNNWRIMMEFVKTHLIELLDYNIKYMCNPYSVDNSFVRYDCNLWYGGYIDHVLELTVN